MNDILVINRDESFKRQIRKVLEAKGLTVIELNTILRRCEIAKVIGASEASTACATACRVQGCAIAKDINPFAAIVNLSQLSLYGLSAVRRLKDLWPETVVIATVDPQDALLLSMTRDALRQGAKDCLVNPVSIVHLGRMIDQVRPGSGRPSSPIDERGPAPNDNALVGHCDAMKSLYVRLLQIGRAEKASGLRRSVLITGETGTGKQLVARALHQAGARPEGPFVEVNCAAIPTPLLEAELFGFEKGAFTDAKVAKPGLFEEADDGTLFLDEICSMEMSVQGKLLKAIEDKSIRRVGGLNSRPVNVRIIAASNKTSPADIGQALRRDLYYRLSAFTVAIPALRDRGEDILVLARFFLERLAKECGDPVKRITPDAERKLLQYTWPGNVRELMHVIECAAIQTQSEVIGCVDLDLVMPSMPSSVSVSKESDVMVEFGRSGLNLEAIEREIIVKALTHANWNRAEAARLLGISKETLRYRIEKFRLAPVSFRANGSDLQRQVSERFKSPELLN
ncbi:MAG: sigma-54-dependent Fis family transcriptional regulator [Nitrospira sp.]|nr:sigma-54-dependent Fis family transcriptional regulator [Nitrospira sp.]